MTAPNNTDDDQRASLTWILSVLRRRWPLLLLPLLAAIGASVAFTANSEPLYRASAEVLIRTEESSNLFPLSDSAALLRSPSAEEGFLGSTEYEDRARETAGADNQASIDVGDVSSRVKPSFITFSAIDGDAETAAAVAQGWALTYIQMRHERDQSELSNTLATMSEARISLDGERSELLSGLEPIDRALSQTTDLDTLSRLTTQRLILMQSLEPSIAPIDSQLEALDNELADLRLIENFISEPELSARINRVAQVPDSPFSPSLPRNVILSVLLGLLVGGALVALRESTDDRLRSADDLSARTGLHPLTTVPHVRRDKANPDLEPRSQIAESFQRLSSAIEFSGVRSGGHQVVMFTSACPAESKTTTIARLGVTHAREGQRALVIGADLRRPTLAKKFGADSGPGLAEILMSTYTFDDCVHTTPDGLDVLRGGTLHEAANPVELLRSPAMTNLIDMLRGRYDRILIDCPPVLPVVDALEISNVCDAIVLNVYARRSRNRYVTKSLSLIAQATSTPVIGFVLTGAKAHEESYSSSYGYYGRAMIGPASDSKPAPVRRREAPVLDLASSTTNEEAETVLQPKGAVSPDSVAWERWLPAEIEPYRAQGTDRSRHEIDSGQLAQIAIRDRATTVAESIKGFYKTTTKGNHQ